MAQLGGFGPNYQVQANSHALPPPAPQRQSNQSSVSSPQPNNNSITGSNRHIGARPSAYNSSAMGNLLHREESRGSSIGTAGRAISNTPTHHN